ncbi:hypothetical protein HK100_008049 [Physocladia obscura]|uniref:Uncharacterized protein n=1 Tax=Physocladia obscura TaxID=109957 RepID=A0AAD5XJU9_9FUNG|nr:hypothetical protein HK100_008049 [Physocladia obscura]
MPVDSDKRVAIVVAVELAAVQLLIPAWTHAHLFEEIQTAKTTASWPIDLTQLPVDIVAYELAAAQLLIPTDEEENYAQFGSTPIAPTPAIPTKNPSTVEIDISKKVSLGPSWTINLALLPDNIAKLEVAAMQLWMPVWMNESPPESTSDIQSRELAEDEGVSETPVYKPKTTIVKLGTVRIKVVEQQQPARKLPAPAQKRTLKSMKSIDAMRGANWPVYYDYAWEHPTGQTDTSRSLLD